MWYCLPSVIRMSWIVSSSSSDRMALSLAHTTSVLPATATTALLAQHQPIWESTSATVIKFAGYVTLPRESATLLMDSTSRLPNRQSASWSDRRHSKPVWIIS